MESIGSLRVFRQPSDMINACKCVQTNMASAMEATLRELYFADGKAVLCITGSLHAVSAAYEYVQ